MSAIPEKDVYKNGDPDNYILRKILGFLHWFSHGDTTLADINTSIQAISGGGLSTQFASQADLVCVTPGTVVQGPNVTCQKGAMVTARFTNTGNIYVGDAAVTNASGSERGIILSQGGMPPQILPVANLNQIYMNADNAGDGMGLVAI